MSDDPNTKYGTKEADAIAKKAMAKCVLWKCLQKAMRLNYGGKKFQTK